MNKSNKQKLTRFAKKFNIDTIERLELVFSTMEKEMVEGFKLYYLNNKSCIEVEDYLNKPRNWTSRTMQLVYSQLEVAGKYPEFVDVAKGFVDNGLVDYVVYNEEKINEFFDYVQEFTTIPNLLEDLQILPSKLFNIFTNYYFKNATINKTSEELEGIKRYKYASVKAELRKIFNYKEQLEFVNSIKKYYKEIDDKEIYYNLDHIKSLKKAVGSDNLDSIFKVSMGLSEFYIPLFVEYYIKGKTFYEIGDQRNISRQATSDSIGVINKILNGFMQIEDYVYTGDSEFKYYTNFTRIINIKKMMGELASNPQFVLTVNEKLVGTERIVFENLIIDVNEEKLKAAGLGTDKQSRDHICRVLVTINDYVKSCKNNFEKVKTLLQDNNENYSKITYDDNTIQDIELFLDDMQKKVFHSFIIEDEPKSIEEFCDENKIVSSDALNIINKTRNIVFDVIKRKQECEKFIEANHGEDFLINEFGPTLNDREFQMLITFLMDYHYTNLYNSAETMGISRDIIYNIKKSVIDKLNGYETQKSNVTKLIEAMGGEEEVLKFANTLDEDEKFILFEIILAYNPLTLKEVSKKVDCAIATVYTKKKKLEEKIDFLINGESDSKKEKTTE